MKIALINENSQAAKNAMIEKALRKVVEPMGHEVFNYGMYTADDDAQLTYVQNGILAATLLNGGATDYVVTGCGTGEGAMLALNSFPGVICGHVEDPLDAYTFAQINDGNAVAMPFALKNGWGQELNLEYTFEKLFGFGSGNGYPAERVVPEQRNKKILDSVREVSFRPFTELLPKLDRDLVRGAFAGEHFQEYFFANATNEAVAKVVREVLASASDTNLALLSLPAEKRRCFSAGYSVSRIRGISGVPFASRTPLHQAKAVRTNWFFAASTDTESHLLGKLLLNRFSNRLSGCSERLRHARQHNKDKEARHHQRDSPTSRNFQDDGLVLPKWTHRPHVSRDPRSNSASD